MENSIQLSIVIPAYNEARRITDTLSAVGRYFNNKSFRAEIIVVDDGSSDTTIDIVKGYFNSIPTLRLIRHRQNQGKGAAIKTGVMFSRGKWILFMDADLATPLTEFDKLWANRKQYDVVIGSRHLEKNSIKTPQPLHRHLFGRLGNTFIQTLLLPGIQDTQCGFKLLSRDTAQDLFSRQTISRFGFDIEVLALAKILSYSILEVAVDWYDKPHGSVNMFRDGYRVFFDVLRIKSRIYMSMLQKTPYTQKI